MPQKPKESSASWMRLSSIGFELVAAVAGFTLLGYWVDRHWGTEPWGVLIGALLGLVGGMYNLIRSSLISSREAGKAAGRDPRRGSDETKGGDPKR